MNFLSLTKLIILYFLTCVLGILIPKDNNIIILASNNGLKFTGNSKAFFLYLCKSQRYRAFFFIRDRKKYLYLNVKHENIKYIYSLSGILTFLRAKTVCMTHGYADFLGLMPSPWQKWINLSHGGSKLLRFLESPVSTTTIFWHFLEFKQYRIVRSDYQKYLFSARYRKDPRNIFITGFPRTDVLIEKNKTTTNINLLYAPTYIEKHKPTNFFNVFGDDTNYLNNFLTANKLKLFIRFHPGNFHESRTLITGLLNEKNIIDLSPDKLEDVQEFLPEIDILITDFSSISQDFLILNRPMIFTTKDLNETSRQSLILREEFSFPGYKVNKPDQIYYAINQILNGKDEYKEIRQFVRNLNYNFIDNRSCERVLKIIDKWNDY